MSRSHPFVYFIRPVGLPGPVKIGCSHAPPDRLEALAVWAPFPLEIAATIPGNITLENKIHGLFAHAHSHREWFHPTADLVAAIARLAAGEAVENVLDLKKETPSLRSRTRKPRAPWSPEKKEAWGWSFRVWRKQAALNKDEGFHRWRCPRVADRALDDWRRNPDRRPSDEVLAAIKAFVAHPRENAVEYVRSGQWGAKPKDDIEREAA